MTSRLAREVRTLEAMIDIYCRREHGAGPRCPECEELALYARARLERCPFGAQKPTCANCLIHCYRRDMRERVRVVMRKAGPHMICRHPQLALMHLLVDARRRPPDQGPVP